MAEPDLFYPCFAPDYVVHLLFKQCDVESPTVFIAEEIPVSEAVPYRQRAVRIDQA